VKAPFVLVAALAPAIAERGDGAIVNLGSWPSEFGPRGVRVNAISPGVMRPIADEPAPAEVMMVGTPAGVAGSAPR